MVDAVLDATIHKGGEVINGIVDTMVGDASLRVIIGTDLAERSPVDTIVFRLEAMSSRYFWCSLS